MSIPTEVQKVLKTIEEEGERQRDREVAERAKRIADSRIELGRKFWEAMEKKDFETLGQLLESSQPSLRDRVFC